MNCHCMVRWGRTDHSRIQNESKFKLRIAVFDTEDTFFAHVLALPNLAVGGSVNVVPSIRSPYNLVYEYEDSGIDSVCVRVRTGDSLTITDDRCSFARVARKDMIVDLQRCVYIGKKMNEPPSQHSNNM